jgi:hypothetical protein
MSATIKIFQVGGKCFSHVMNAYHDSVELRDEVNETLLTYDADARVSNPRGRMGTFHIEYLEGQPCWVYYEMPLQTRTVFGTDLITAEVEVSKRFIGNTCASETNLDPASSVDQLGLLTSVALPQIALSA